MLANKKEIFNSVLNDQTLYIRERCRRSFFHFVYEFWSEVSNDVPQWNWHIPYLCGELSKLVHQVGLGEPKKYDLIINIPPGTTKSTVCSVMLQPWAWINYPWIRFINASYSSALSLDHAEYSRDIVRSAKFKELFPEIQIKRDKDTKSNFKIQQLLFDDDGNVRDVKSGGNRFSTSVGGTLTGFHGHILLVDDPCDPNAAVSEKELATANRWMSQTLSTRKINKAVTPTVLIMQRLHQDDPTGHILAKKKKNVRHICLPGEIKNYPEQVKPQELLQYYKNDLLDPTRMNWTVMKDMEADLGQYGYAGQIGQDPSPPGGGMFKVEHFQYIDQLPPDAHILKKIRYWDKAGSVDSGAYTVGVKIYQFNNKKFCIVDVKRGQWASEQREKIIKQTAQADGHDVVVWQEQEPGSGGKEQAQATVLNLAGFSVFSDRPTGDKIFRADPFSVQVNNGNVMLLKGDWTQKYVEEHRYFPFGTYKDQVDASAGGFNKLVNKKQVRII